jgi:hypothetical protein
MTEAEWLTCDTPTLLLAHVRGTLSQRKDRLLAVALCSIIWDIILDERSRRALEVAEAFADGMVSADELRMAYGEAVDAGRDGARGNHAAMGGGWDDAQMIAADAVGYCAAPDSSYVSMLTIHAADAVTYRAAPDCSYVSMLTVQRTLSAAAYRGTLDSDTPLFLRVVYDVVGNPFRPVVDAGWRIHTVTQLAWAIYAERGFDRLPILADTLEDAGCTARAILDHLRESGPHVRGCWALDLLLGKS